MQTIKPFRKCHLQILRSLYNGQDLNVTTERRGDGRQLLDGGVHDDDSSTADGNGMNENEEINANDDAKAKRPSGTDGVAADNNDDSEGPVGCEIWDLIDRFLQQRVEYRPHKERQIHWANVNDEALCRLDHLESISTTKEEEKKMPMIRSSSLTPRTPLFAASGRAGTMQSQHSLSLTPQSSNRNAPKLSDDEIEMASTIPAWNFISQMLQRRSRLCTQSCQSIRSQPFLAQLQNEAEMRCKILESVLKRLKLGTGTQQQNGKKRGGSLTMLNHSGKRQKVGKEGTRPTVLTSLGHFFPEKYSDFTDLDEVHYDDESIMATQMKLCLWSSLLSSVKEIVDES